MSADMNDPELSESDKQARRLVDIVITLTNSRRPVSSSRIRELHYPGTSEGSFRKLFSRDRLRLSVCGISVTRTNNPPDEGLWVIDDGLSFVDGAGLDPTDALALDIACRPLVADQDFPLSNDLLMALAKIDRSFSGRSPIVIPKSTHPRDRRLALLETCFLKRHAIRTSYTTSDDVHIHRIICIYGIFSLSGHTYVVGPQIEEDAKGSSPLPGSMRTYRADRFNNISECKGITYSIPPDFDVHDHMRLPFQLGPTMYYASFVVPAPAVQDLIRDSHGLIQIDSTDDSTLIRLPVSDETVAAEWAVAEGIVPREPASLVRLWRSTLTHSLEDSDDGR